MAITKGSRVPNLKGTQASGRLIGARHAWCRQFQELLVEDQADGKDGENGKPLVWWADYPITQVEWNDQ